MEKTNKKTLLVTLLVVLFSAMLLVGGISIGTTKPQVNAKVSATTSATLSGNWKDSLIYNITNLTITTNYTPQADNYYAQKFDVSEAEDGSLYAYVFANGTDTSNNTIYDCVIYGNVDTIYAPEYSAGLFSGDINEYIKCLVNANLNGLSFDNCKQMSNLFDFCINLKSVIFSSTINTSSVENMSSMFSNCSSLLEVNFDNWNTVAVQDFSEMFAVPTFSVMANLAGLDINSETFFTDLYNKMTGETFVGQSSTIDDQQEAKAFFEQNAGFADESPLKNLNLSSFTISSTATTTNMFIGLELDTLITPQSCAQEIVLPTTMYKEGTAEEVSVLPSTSMVLVKDANAFASDYQTGGSTTPATGFDMNDIVLTTTLGLSLMVAVAVVFAKKQKRFINK